MAQTTAVNLGSAAVAYVTYLAVRYLVLPALAAHGLVTVELRMVPA